MTQAHLHTQLNNKKNNPIGSMYGMLNEFTININEMWVNTYTWILCDLKLREYTYQHIYKFVYPQTNTSYFHPSRFLQHLPSS